MTRPWKEPGLFNDYHSAKTEHGHEVLLEKKGCIELTIDTWDGDVCAWLTLDELEKLAQALRALMEYDEAETQRVRNSHAVCTGC